MSLKNNSVAPMTRPLTAEPKNRETQALEREGYPPMATGIPPCERLLTKEEVAALCQVSTRCVERWMARGSLQHMKLGRNVRFRRIDVEMHLTTFYGTLRKSPDPARSK